MVDSYHCSLHIACSKPPWVDYSVYIFIRLHYKLSVSLENLIRTLGINQNSSFLLISLLISLLLFQWHSFFNFPITSDIQIHRPFQYRHFHENPDEAIKLPNDILTCARNVLATVYSQVLHFNDMINKVKCAKLFSLPLGRPCLQKKGGVALLQST